MLSSSFLSIVLTFHSSCSHCPSPSWSLPQLLSEQVLKTPNVKKPSLSGQTQQTGKLHTHTQLLSLFYSLNRLAPCFLCCFQLSQSSSSILNSIPALTLMSINGEKKRIQSERLDSSYLSNLRLVTELDLTFVCEDCVSFLSPHLQSQYHSAVPHIRLMSHLKLSPHPPSGVTKWIYLETQTNLTIGTFCASTSSFCLV